MLVLTLRRLTNPTFKPYILVYVIAKQRDEILRDRYVRCSECWGWRGGGQGF